MDKYVLAASVGLDKAIALCRVEPLHCTYCHGRLSPGIFERHKLVTKIRRKKGQCNPGKKEAAAKLRRRRLLLLLSRNLIEGSSAIGRTVRADRSRRLVEPYGPTGQGSGPTQPKAIRRLVELGLKTKPKA